MRSRALSRSGFSGAVLNGGPVGSDHDQQDVANAHDLPDAYDEVLAGLDVADVEKKVVPADDFGEAVI